MKMIGYQLALVLLILATIVSGQQLGIKTIALTGRNLTTASLASAWNQTNSTVSSWTSLDHGPSQPISSVLAYNLNAPNPTNPTNPPNNANLISYNAVASGAAAGAGAGTEHKFGSLINATSVFLNKTRSHMPTGYCYEEVPTVSLLKGARLDHIPAGNGSNPTLSRIQVCCKGYERNVHNFRKCDPICSQGCINGLCVEPERCECYPDHVRNLAQFCIPTCPIGCANGDCQLDGSCACKLGYQLDVSRKFCIPRCSQGCGNGNCTEPDTCVCNKGYRLNAAKRCEAICTGGCLNGDCVAPEQCTCRTGYEKVDKVCQPVCVRGCANGKCVAPNVCQCESGWILDGSGSKCLAHCDTSCLNGYCSGANKCSCHIGYIPDKNDLMKCVPYCANGCPFGICSGPNFCICNQGYVKDRSIKGSQNCVPRIQ